MNTVYIEGDGHREQVPRGALIAAALLIVLTIGIATLARVTGIGRDIDAPVAALVSVDLSFTDQTDGSIVVARWPDQSRIAELKPGTNGFARGVLRALVRERRLASIDAARMFRLTRWADGRLTIADPATGEHIELNNFGPTNQAVFTQILSAATAS